MEGRPWSEWRQGKRLSPRGLASLLKPFQGEPKKHQAHGPKSSSRATIGHTCNRFGTIISQKGRFRIRYCRYREETKGLRGFSIRYQADGGSGYENL